MNENIAEKKWISNGFECHVMKMTFESDGSFHRCGYVTIPKKHICSSMSYDDIPLNIHGGLTYSEGSTFGFDTAHSGDLRSNELERKGHFWSLEDVVKETNKMARQFSKITMLQIMKYKLRYMPHWFKKNIQILIKEKK